MIVILMSQVCLKSVTITGSYNIKKSKENTEIYTENLSINNYLHPTNKISVSDSLRYTKTKKGTDETEVITPTGTLSINNDIFNLNFSGTISETLKTRKEDIFSSNYDINFSSFYKRIINLNLTYTNSRTYDNLNPKKMDTKTNQYGITLKRNFYKRLSVIYDFKKTENKNKVKDLKNINYAENVILSLNGLSFNHSKFTSSISANYNYRKNKMKADVNESGIALFPVSANIDISPILNGVTTLFDNQTIIIKIPATGIDIVYFYKNGLYEEELDKNIKWIVYWSKTGKEDSYEIIASEISFPFKVNEEYKYNGYLKFKILNLPEQNVELNNPVIQCYLIKTSTKGYAELKNFSRSFTFNLNSGYQFNNKLETFYDLTYSHNNSSPGLKKDSISQSISTEFIINKYFNINTQLSRDDQKTEKSPLSTTYNFSFTNNSELLNTLTSTFSYGYTLNLVSNKKINSSNNFNLTLNAQIYPDLIAKWNNSFTINKSYFSNSEAKTVSSSINITARFTPSITFISNYTLTKNISPSSTLDQNITNNLSWRISEMMFINIGQNIILPDSGKKNYNNTISFWVAPTKKIQYNLTYTFIRGDTNSDSISNFLSWKIGEKLSTKFTFNKKIIKGEHTWDAMFSLNFAF